MKKNNILYQHIFILLALGSTSFVSADANEIADKKDQLIMPAAPSGPYRSQAANDASTNNKKSEQSQWVQDPSQQLRQSPPLGHNRNRNQPVPPAAWVNKPPVLQPMQPQWTQRPPQQPVPTPNWNSRPPVQPQWAQRPPQQAIPAPNWNRRLPIPPQWAQRPPQQPMPATNWNRNPSAPPAWVNKRPVPPQWAQRPPQMVQVPDWVKNPPYGPKPPAWVINPQQQPVYRYGYPRRN